MSDAHSTEAEPIQVLRPLYRTRKILKALKGCFDSGWTGYGTDCLAFESQWCAATGLPHAHFVNSATAGLQLAVRIMKEAYGWEDGSEIISTPLTFVATNHVILHERLQPVFADVDATLTLDPNSVADRITSRTRAVMFVGLGGNPGRLEEIAALCAQHGLRLILDAAHLAGASIRGQHVGLQADAAVFSFQTVKNLSAGQGGMLCFRDPALDATSRRLAWFGISRGTFDRVRENRTYTWDYEVEDLGFNFQGNSILARVGQVQLCYLERDNATRRRLAEVYDRALQGEPDVILAELLPGHLGSRHLYQLMSPHREAIARLLQVQGIQTSVHYRTNQDHFLYRGFPGPCPRSDRYSATLLTLPLHPSMTRRDALRVVTAVIAALRTARGGEGVGGVK